MPLDRLQLIARMSKAAVVIGSLCAQGQAPASGASVARSDSSGTVMGRLVDMDDAQPVPYATVMVVGSGLASARQIGYAPQDTVITIGPAPA